MNYEEIGRAVVEYVQAVVAQDDGLAADEERIKDRLRSEGYRIVDGGQVGAHDESRYEVTDEATGEVLLSGVFTFEEFCAETDRHEDWYHVDHILDDWFDEHPSVPVPEVLPPGFMQDPHPDELRPWLKGVAP